MELGGPVQQTHHLRLDWTRVARVGLSNDLRAFAFPGFVLTNPLVNRTGSMPVPYHLA